MNNPERTTHRPRVLARLGVFLMWSAAALALGPGGCKNAEVGPSALEEEEAPIPQRLIFTMDYSSAAYPDCGWQALPLGPSWQAAHLPGAGPRGRDAIELRQVPRPDARFYGGQFDWGWRGHIEPSDLEAGARRYYRWRQYFTPDSNFKGLDWSDGHEGNITNKVLIVGQNCGDRCRVILSYRTNRESQRVGYFRLQIDGGEDYVETGPYDRGGWLNIQVELSASNAGAADGGYKVWINTDSYSRPTAVRTGIVLRPANWGYVWFGAFNNDGLASEGTHAFRHTDFVAAETFDNTWNRAVR